MDIDGTDTVSPLDGDGHNVVDPTESGNVPAEDFDTKGKTTVATRRGYAFNPSNKDLPQITSAGVKMTKDQADEVVAESANSKAAAFIVSDDENKED